MYEHTQVYCLVKTHIEITRSCANNQLLGNRSGYKCKRTQRCQLDYESGRDRFYCACRKYCPEMETPQWVCSNDGQTYRSECLLQLSDCFAGRVYVAKRGKCDYFTGKYLTMKIAIKLTKTQQVELALKRSYLQMLYILLLSKTSYNLQKNSCSRGRFC